MKRLGALLAVGALTLTACQDTPTSTADAPDALAARGAAVATAQGAPFVPGEVLLRVKQGVDPAAVAEAHGAEVAGSGYQNRFTVLRGAVGSERALAARLGGDERVQWAEPNWLRQPHTIDPRLWAFYNPGGLSIDFTRGRNKGSPVTNYLSTNDADEDNDEGYYTGGSPVVIGSIDTGVDFGHSEFSGGLLIAGHDWYDDDGDPSDQDGHGTHTTGTMVGHTVGVAGVAGAGSNVKVYVQRVCGSIGCPTSAIVSAINAAADYPGMVAMNLSLGGGSLGQAESDAIAYATGKGVLVIASAGNDGTGTVSCPACDDNAISVAATNWQDELSYYSNWGPGLDISAPGGEMYSNTTEESGIYSSVPGGYAFYQGTSMAAPQVTGTAGVVASMTGKTGSDLRSQLLGTVDDLGVQGYDQTYGEGRLNSLRAATSGGGTPTNQAPTASFTSSCGGLTCDFTDTSSDTDGSVVSWSWSFEGGGSSTQQNPSHTFASGGTYSVTLTVTDDDGASGTTSQDVTVTSPGGSGIDLTASGYKVKGVQHTSLSWTGSTAAMTIFRNGNPVGTTSGTSYDDDIGVKGGGVSYTYQVCETASPSTCSNEVTVVF